MKKEIPFEKRGYYTKDEIRNMLSKVKNITMKNTSIKIQGDMLSSLTLSNLITNLLTNKGYRVTIGMHKVEKDPKNRIGNYDASKIRVYVNFRKKGGK